MKKKFNEYIKDKYIICDGAFGTYYASKYQTTEISEIANEKYPERVLEIHREYIDAGAKLLRTNTFCSNTVSLYEDFNKVRQNIVKAIDIAKIVAGDSAYVAGDIGPIECENVFENDKVIEEYINLSKIFIEQKTDVIIFETFSNITDIIPAINYIKDNSDIFVIVQFAVSQFGYSSFGYSARRLFSDAEKSRVDAYGLNCGIGPGHMLKIFEQADIKPTKYITAIPNAGYPNSINNRFVFFENNSTYFAQKSVDLLKYMADITGGCCGTSPEYIKMISELSSDLKKSHEFSEKTVVKNPDKKSNKLFLNNKKNDKLIAVELAPPLSSDDKKIMEAAHFLKNTNVDVLTFPDSPSGRTRIDSILMAVKVFKETGMCVMPHLCCRDKNAIAIRSEVMGAHINGVDNFLIMTGDPVPTQIRSNVKPVFNFDSVGMMNIISDMNEEIFDNNIVSFGGVINQNRNNLDVEINRVRKKIDAGAKYFFTQPVFSDYGVERLRRIKKETNAVILCGIMPLVSLKNALFMKNEMTGINVDDEILSRYSLQQSKEEGENTGVEIAKEIIEKTQDFIDGYYFSFPFNRVYLLDKILKN